MPARDFQLPEDSPTFRWAKRSKINPGPPGPQPPCQIFPSITDRVPHPPPVPPRPGKSATVSWRPGSPPFSMSHIARFENDQV